MSRRAGDSGRRRICRGQSGTDTRAGYSASGRPTAYAHGTDARANPAHAGPVRACVELRSRVGERAHRGPPQRRCWLRRNGYAESRHADVDIKQIRYNETDRSGSLLGVTRKRFSAHVRYIWMLIVISCQCGGSRADRQRNAFLSLFRTRL